MTRAPSLPRQPQSALPIVSPRIKPSSTTHDPTQTTGSLSPCPCHIGHAQPHPRTPLDPWHPCNHSHHSNQPLASPPPPPSRHHHHSCATLLVCKEHYCHLHAQSPPPPHRRLPRGCLRRLLLLHHLLLHTHTTITWPLTGHCPESRASTPPFPCLPQAPTDTPGGPHILPAPATPPHPSSSGVSLCPSLKPPPPCVQWMAVFTAVFTQGPDTCVEHSEHVLNTCVHHLGRRGIGSGSSRSSSGGGRLLRGGRRGRTPTSGGVLRAPRGITQRGDCRRCCRPPWRSCSALRALSFAASA